MQCLSFPFSSSIVASSILSAICGFPRLRVVSQCLQSRFKPQYPHVPLQSKFEGHHNKYAHSVPQLHFSQWNTYTLLTNCILTNRVPSWSRWISLTCLGNFAMKYTPAFFPRHHSRSSWPRYPTRRHSSHLIARYQPIRPFFYTAFRYHNHLFLWRFFEHANKYQTNAVAFCGNSTPSTGCHRTNSVELGGEDHLCTRFEACV